MNAFYRVIVGWTSMQSDEWIKSEFNGFKTGVNLFRIFPVIKSIGFLPIVREFVTFENLGTKNGVK